MFMSRLRGKIIGTVSCCLSEVSKWTEYILVHKQASPLRTGVTSHPAPAEVTFPPLPQPINAGTRFSNSRGMQGWVDLCMTVAHSDMYTQTVKFFFSSSYRWICSSMFSRVFYLMFLVWYVLASGSLPCEHNLASFRQCSLFSGFGRQYLAVNACCMSLPSSNQHCQSTERNKALSITSDRAL